MILDGIVSTFGQSGKGLLCLTYDRIDDGDCVQKQVHTSTVQDPDGIVYAGTIGKKEKPRGNSRTKSERRSGWRPFMDRHAVVHRGGDHVEGGA